MAKRPRPTSDALEILHRRVYEGRPHRLKKLEEARANEDRPQDPRVAHNRRPH